MAIARLRYREDGPDRLRPEPSFLGRPGCQVLKRVPSRGERGEPPEHVALEVEVLLELLGAECGFAEALAAGALVPVREVDEACEKVGLGAGSEGQGPNAGTEAGRHIPRGAMVGRAGQASDHPSLLGGTGPGQGLEVPLGSAPSSRGLVGDDDRLEARELAGREEARVGEGSPVAMKLGDALEARPRTEALSPEARRIGLDVTRRKAIEDGLVIRGREPAHVPAESAQARDLGRPLHGGSEDGLQVGGEYARALKFLGQRREGVGHLQAAGVSNRVPLALREPPGLVLEVSQEPDLRHALSNGGSRQTNLGERGAIGGHEIGSEPSRPVGLTEVGVPFEKAPQAREMRDLGPRGVGASGQPRSKGLGVLVRAL